MKFPSLSPRGWLAALFAVLAAFGVMAARPALAAPKAPLVLAAASLQESLDAAADEWGRTGHPRPVVSFAASSALARQIEAGAPADLFVSADEEWMDYLAGKGQLKAGTRRHLTANRLVLVAPVGSRVVLAPRSGFPLARALGTGRLAMADPDSVPAGRYGKQALSALGVWPAVADRLARAENVRAALALVARGEAPLGIVYATDARAAPGVRVVAKFPASSHRPISYPLAVPARSANPEGAAFVRFLVSPRGQAIFARFGFGGR